MTIHVYQYQAVCHDSSNCVYTVNRDNTPTVSSIDPFMITESPVTLTLLGSAFATSGVSVIVGNGDSNDSCVVQTSDINEVRL